jgi:hypothetical protein
MAEKMLQLCLSRVSAKSGAAGTSHRLFWPMARMVLLGLSLSLNSVEAKICVETATDVFLCTDDVAKARAAVSRENGGSARMSSANYDYGVAQQNNGNEKETKAVREALEKMEEYFQSEVLPKSEYDDVREKCKLKHELCAFWAAVHDECNKNRPFMTKECAPICLSCDEIRST